MKHRGYTGIIVYAVLFAAACSFEPPAVVQVKTERLYFRNVQGTIAEQLSVFVVFEDPDGKNDYKALTLSEDATGLSWTITRENTVFLHESSQSVKQQWVGSNKFLYPRGAFPPGTYHIALSDLSGHTTVKSVQLGTPIDFMRIPFDLVFENAVWRIKVYDTSICSRFRLILLGSDMQPLYTEAVSEPFTGMLSELREKAEGGRYIQCLGENTGGTAGFITPAVPIPE